ncbi:unnamed protein product [Amaranthus hypochondriacus]
MRLSMKSFIPNNNNNSNNNNKPCLASSTHVPTQKYCSISTLTHKLAFQSQQSLHHHSLNNFESTFLDPIRPTTLVQSRPMGRLADCWQDYMGVRDWAGLLDPLDDKLRHEILRYGNFIEATYRAFDFDPGSPSYGSCKYLKKSLLEDCGIPNDGYRITRHLRATSGIKVPEWARSSWAALQSSWVGYVAICNNKAVIERLGRREVVIALRGTATCLEWLENLRATLAPVPEPKKLLNNNNVGPYGPPLVESGFLSLYTSGSDMWPSLQDAIRMEVRQILQTFKEEALSITITGHSLGAALATLAAYDIKTMFNRAPLVTVVSFGGPRVGNLSFRSLVDKQGIKILRVVNPSDLIIKVPGFVTNNNDQCVSCKNKKLSKNTRKVNKTTHYKYNVKNKFIFKNNNNVHNINNKSYSKKVDSDSNPLKRLISSWMKPFRVEDTQWWVYAEVGHELRLQNEEAQQIPSYLSNINVAKCHDLKTYLNLVEGKGCPLKALVRRSLRKLTHPHKTNHKNNGGALVI